LSFGWRRHRTLALGAILALALVHGASAASVSVFVSILPQKYFVERIAGPLADVTVMVGQVSPETYEPKPRQVAQLARADAYFEIGVPFERVWMPRLRAANPNMLVVDTTTGIRRRSVADSSGRSGTRDPHVWTNPLLAKAMAAHIRDAFLRLDPQHAADYERNYHQFAADLDALDGEIRARLSPFAGRAFLVFHAAWGYFADAYGLRQIAIEAEGKEPGPRTLAGVIDEAKALGSKVVFVQPQFSRANAEMIAREIDGRVTALDPLAEDYIENIRNVAASVAESMAPP
jgi:zinc transport system substrate-binding protein